MITKSRNLWIICYQIIKSSLSNLVSRKKNRKFDRKMCFSQGLPFFVQINDGVNKINCVLMATFAFKTIHILNQNFSLKIFYLNLYATMKEKMTEIIHRIYVNWNDSTLKACKTNERIQSLFLSTFLDKKHNTK